MLVNTIRNIRNSRLQQFILKLLYRKNGLRLEGFDSYGGRFFIYKVNGQYLPSESINWYTSPAYLHKHASDISMWRYQVQRGDVVVDIGAGLGEEALVFSALAGGNGKVYAIEANPSVFAILQKTVALNALRNVTPLHLAVNREDAPVRIVDADATYMTGFVGVEETGPSTEVQGLRFDSFMAKHGLRRIDLLKCNIEGAERFLVDSISAPFVARIANVAIACHDFRYGENRNGFFVTREHVTRFLTAHGFEVSTQNTGADYIDDWVYGSNPAFAPQATSRS